MDENPLKEEICALPMDGVKDGRRIGASANLEKLNFFVQNHDVGLCTEQLNKINGWCAVTNPACEILGRARRFILTVRVARGLK